MTMSTMTMSETIPVDPELRRYRWPERLLYKAAGRSRLAFLVAEYIDLTMFAFADVLDAVAGWLDAAAERIRSYHQRRG